MELKTVTRNTLPAESKSGKNPNPGPGLRVLLVEDHVDSAKVLARILSRWGHTVVTAGDVQSGLTEVSRAAFDIVISDLGLPDGSGLDLMRQINATRPVPAIALTGYGMDEDIERTREAGFACHLTKPVDMEQLREALDKLTASEP